MSQTPETRPKLVGSGNLSAFGRADNLENKLLERRNQARKLRLQYLARRLHALGPYPLYHFLDEVERGEPLRAHLERDSRLPAEFIRAHGGDQFAPALRAIDGGGQ